MLALEVNKGEEEGKRVKGLWCSELDQQHFPSVYTTLHPSWGLYKVCKRQCCEKGSVSRVCCLCEFDTRLIRQSPHLAHLLSFLGMHPDGLVFSCRQTAEVV